MGDAPDLGTPLLSTLGCRVEAAIFAAPRPVALGEIAALLPEGVDLDGVIDEIEAFWADRGVQVVRSPAGLAMRAREDMLPKLAPAPLRRMSEAAGATLMAIAMHQPATVRQVEEVRGVRLARGIIESLEASDLIRSVGRRRATGRAALYETTERFLDAVGIEQLADLPTTEEALMMDLEPSREDVGP